MAAFLLHPSIFAVLKVLSNFASVTLHRHLQVAEAAIRDANMLIRGGLGVLCPAQGHLDKDSGQGGDQTTQSTT